VVEKYKEIVEAKGVSVNTLTMDELPVDFLKTESFGNRTTAFEDLIHKKIASSDRFVIIAPEYNGSYPGIFKAFLDALTPQIWKAKKIALVGVASGRAGNQRGMDHLTDVFHHLRAEVFSLKVPISRLEELIEDNKGLVDSLTINALQAQIDEFIRF
jgi:NAD(P)H-dependent FMN reductase